MSVENEKSIEETETNQSMMVYIFDMDGTLYQLDGEDNGFSSSSLEQAVLKKAKQFILDREDCSEAYADSVLERGLEDPIGLSHFLSQRYDISREEYFDIVWDINPEGIVINFKDAVEVVKQISADNQRLILLTSAPKIWQVKVLEFLRIMDCFEEIYTGDTFAQKQEIFELIGQKYGTSNVISIGDQLETDINPAQSLGMQTLLINCPSDLKILLKRKENL